MTDKKLKPCIVKDCCKIAKKGDKYCSMHRARLTRTGRLDKKSLGEKLTDNIKLVNGCWEWQGFRNRGGYGRLRVSGRKMLAHRASYVEFVGEIPEDKIICHTCDNPCCINPAHLWVGTHKENYDDALAKGRVDPVARGLRRWELCPTFKKA